MASRTGRALLRGLLPATLLASVLAGTPAGAVVGPEQPDTSYAFTAQLTVGDYQHGCSAVLVARNWLLTAASCFAADPAASLTVPAGKPAQPTVATIGGTDLTTGEKHQVAELVPYPGRDVVLARLDTPVLGIAPAKVSGTPAAAGEQLVTVGYGRTADEWAPLQPHSGTFTTDAVNGTDVQVSGQDGATVCMGDTGGPVLRTTPGGTPEVVALSSRSYQVGCFGVDTADGTPNTAVDTRVDDLASWIAGQTWAPRFNDADGDGRSDVSYLYNYGALSSGALHSALWEHTSNGSGFNAPTRPWDTGTTSWNWDRTKVVAGDFDGDGRSDVGALYNYGANADGSLHTALWTFTSNGSGYNAPVKVWDTGTTSWNWDRTKLISGDFNGDGRSDVGALYNYGANADGSLHSALWTFTSTGSGFNAPVRVWDTGTSSWNWDRTMLVAGDFNGDGRSDVGALYNYGANADGSLHSALWTFTSTGSGFNAPVRVWDTGTTSWNWDRTKLVAGDFNGDGRSDVGALYDYGTTSDGVAHTKLWTFTSTGTGFNAPVQVWDSGTQSFDWNQMKPAG